ncbi:helix-turn-helix transcriptional regulator [Lolliginicoccus suaedae]|uniref:helix-turn-helix transcriptional regulator n=1 Tax=Lolliginicoccus suaedae TaxID=2605429 RepID=UPI001F47AC23|nr:LuxR C-terminal-related transcriptional regulator [Lolliginicoccus suaedae]
MMSLTTFPPAQPHNNEPQDNNEPCDNEGVANGERPRPSLSSREQEVLLAWIKADTKDEVCNELNVAIGTINTYLARVRSKYAAVGRPASTKAALLARVLQDGMIDLDEL